MERGSMRVLVIGGTRFIGRHAVEQLVAGGSDVAVFHRGETEPPDLPTVTHIHGARSELADHRSAVAAFAPDVVLDMVPMTAQDAAIVVEALGGIADRVVAISSQDV